MQRPVAELSPADPGDVQQDVEPAAQGIEGEREQPRDLRLRPRPARTRIPRPGRAARAAPSPSGRSPAIGPPRRRAPPPRGTAAPTPGRCRWSLPRSGRCGRRAGRVVARAELSDRRTIGRLHGRLKFLDLEDRLDLDGDPAGQARPCRRRSGSRRPRRRRRPSSGRSSR